MQHKIIASNSIIMQFYRNLTRIFNIRTRSQQFFFFHKQKQIQNINYDLHLFDVFN